MLTNDALTAPTLTTASGSVALHRGNSVRGGKRVVRSVLGLVSLVHLHVRHAADNLYPAAGLERAVVDLYLLLYSLHNQVYEMIVTSL